jgi:hypothetical protein
VASRGAPKACSPRLPAPDARHRLYVCAAPLIPVCVSALHTRRTRGPSPLPHPTPPHPTPPHPTPPHPHPTHPVAPLPPSRTACGRCTLANRPRRVHEAVRAPAVAPVAVMKAHPRSPCCSCCFVPAPAAAAPHPLFVANFCLRCLKLIGAAVCWGGCTAGQAASTTRPSGPGRTCTWTAWRPPCSTLGTRRISWRRTRTRTRHGGDTRYPGARAFLCECAHGTRAPAYKHTHTPVLLVRWGGTPSPRPSGAATSDARSTLPHLHAAQIPDDVADVMANPKAEALSSASAPFWFLVAALRAFVAAGDGSLPLSGQVPPVPRPAARSGTWKGGTEGGSQWLSIPHGTRRDGGTWCWM